MQQRRTRGARGVGWAVGLLVAAPNVAAAQGPNPLEDERSGLLAAAVKMDRGAAAGVKARDPFGSSKALAALTRFVGGQLGSTAYDRRVAATLGKVSNAREIARRIVQPFEAMGANERAAMLGTSGLFDRAALEEWHAQSEAGKTKGEVVVLAPDPVDGKGRAHYELAYRGLHVVRPGDADGTDEAAVVASLLVPGEDRTTLRTFPESGTVALPAGATTAAGAGAVWTGTRWPGGWNSGAVLLVAVIEDGGKELAARREELRLLVELARSEAQEDDAADRMRVLRRELEAALDLLTLGGITSVATQVRVLSGADLDALTLQAATTAPVAHRLAMTLSPRGGEHTVYFDAPPPQGKLKTVVVTVKAIEALGGGRDQQENKLADFAMQVAIDAHTPASTTRSFAPDHNSLRPGWSVERRVQAGSNVRIVLDLWDIDPPPATGCLHGSGWPLVQCQVACGDVEPSCTPGRGGQCPSYAGVCPALQVEYDIHPQASANRRSFQAVFDLGSNTLSGDIDGPAGAYTLTGTPGADDRARVVVEIKQR